MNRKKKGKCSRPIQDDDGKVLTNPYEIVNEQTDYYRALLPKNKSDLEFESSVVHTVNDHVAVALFGDTFITGGIGKLREVTRDINKLKNRKAPGYDYATNEHL